MSKQRKANKLSKSDALNQVFIQMKKDNFSLLQEKLSQIVLKLKKEKSFEVKSESIDWVKKQFLFQIAFDKQFCVKVVISASNHDRNFTKAYVNGKSRSRLLIISASSSDSEASLENLLRHQIAIRLTGIDSEKLVGRVLEKMRNNPYYSIYEFHKSNSFQDKAGTDFFIGYHSGDNWRKIELNLQVKSSLGYQAIHKEKYPDKPSIVVHFNSSFNNIEKAIWEIMKANMRGEYLHLEVKAGN